MNSHTFHVCVSWACVVWDSTAGFQVRAGVPLLYALWPVVGFLLPNSSNIIFSFYLPFLPSRSSFSPSLPPRYLHTNCFAAIANMAPHCRRIHSYAAQRLVGLVDVSHYTIYT